VGHAPDQARPGQKVSLEILIASDAQGSPAAALKPIVVPPQGVAVEVTVYAPNFLIETEQTQTIAVPFKGDSDPIRFVLLAQREGNHTIQVSAWLGQVHLGSLNLRMTINYAAPPGQVRAQTAPAVIRLPVQGEISLEVSYDVASRRYSYTLRDGNETGVTKFEATSLSGSNTAQVDQFVAVLNAQARGLTGYGPQETRELMVGYGSQLWKDLIPEPIKSLILDNIDSIKRINLFSRDPQPIPWELLYPYQLQPRHEFGFLGERCMVSRWHHGPAAPETLRREIAVCVLPWQAPATAEGEISLINALLNGGPPVRTLPELLDVLKNKSFDVLHFASHNNTETNYWDASYVPMPASATEPIPQRFQQSFLGPIYEGRFRQPLIFMNACRSDAQVPQITRLSGWADKFLTAGAGAFIGSQWEIRDTSASTFAETFYKETITLGRPLGQAFQNARQAIQNDQDPTWLAYSFYGNPDATLR
jgi:hypothetical protein